MNTPDFKPHLDKLVAELDESGCIKTALVRNAFLTVPRHQFVDSYYDLSSDEPLKIDVDKLTDEVLAFLYSNEAIPTAIEGGRPTSSTSQPGIVAIMLELLALEPDMKVLEIGAGTGYNAALMAEIVGDQRLVVSVDIQEQVLKRTKKLLALGGYSDIHLVLGDGADGVTEHASFDRIIATVGCPDLSPQWAEQLKPDGFMVLPLMLGGWYPITRVWKEDHRLLGKFVAESGFMLIQGDLQDNFWPYTHGQVMSTEDVERHSAVDKFDTDALKLLGFHKFVALTDRRTFCNYNPRGYGLSSSEDDFAILLAESGEVIAKGDRQCYADLLAYYEQWQELGHPGRDDWLFEFVPIDEDVSGVDAVAVCTRKMYHQVARLR